MTAHISSIFEDRAVIDRAYSGSPYESKTRTESSEAKDRTASAFRDYREPTHGAGLFHGRRTSARRHARRGRRKDRHEEVAGLPSGESQSCRKGASADSGSRDTAVYGQGRVRHQG